MTSIFAKIQLFFLLVFGYIRKHFFFFISGIVTGSLAVMFLPAISGRLVTQNQSAIVGLVGNYTVSTLPLEVQEKISYGLTAIGPSGEVLPAISDSFESTDEGKTIIFNLKNNLFWQDGTKLSSRDINYRLKGVRIDKTTDKITFHLNGSFSPLPAILSQPLFKTGITRSLPYLPKTLNRALFENGLVGLGEYQVTAVRSKGRFLSEIDLKRSSDNFLLSYKFFPSEKIALLALKLGQVTQVSNVYDAKVFLRNNDYRVSERTLPNTQAMLFFNNNESLFSDKKIRQAFTYALPDTWSQGQTARTPLPLNSWAISGSSKKYPHDLSSALTLLGETASSSAQTYNLTLTVNPLLMPSADQILSSWKETGINANIETADFLPGRYQAYLTLVELPPDPDQYFLWHSTQRTNISNYKSPKTDKLLEEGRKTLDRKTRLRIYSDFQKAITEDSPAAFLFYPTVYDVKRKY